ncbi:hypothetical protein Lgra_2358 [Legionella gratiana]|uniref:Uncharacterized protein n=1 Tax=Legionella gratiana TaxID=45066 RepID=A0A378JCX4_9GAMM|nr:hypothetical protein [Legionella gratiana]KTD09123.1 hypothetical protein Lgra_2358 [Legionella gratiana]STX45663.1 Uncharacterised protein [Legionella gratiana]
MLSKYISESFAIKTIFNLGSTKKEETIGIVPSTNPLVHEKNSNNVVSVDNPTLSPEHLAPIGPESTNTWNKKKLILSEKTRFKYNVATCTAVNINDHGAKLLTDAYHKIHGLPGFVHRFLHGRPSLERALFVQAPEMYPIFDTPCDESKTILMTNPAYLDTKKFLSDCKVSTNYALKQLKNSENGLALVTWYIHPEALPPKFRSKKCANKILASYRHELMQQAELTCNSITGKQPFDYYRYGKDMTPLQLHGSFSKLPRTMSQESITELESKSDHNYLACLFDLDHNKEKSLIYLKSLRASILANLETVYGVTPEDKIKIYLHMPYLEATTTLHVHIRVNQADHGLEDAKSFGLNEIITTLEEGGSVTDMILDRGTIYCSEYPLGENIEGVNVKTVPNLKRDWNDIFHLLEADKITVHYLLHALQNNGVKNRMQLLDIEQIGKLLKIIDESDEFPIIEKLIDLIKKLEINPELRKLGWSLETGTCEEQEVHNIITQKQVTNGTVPTHRNL